MVYMNTYLKKDPFPFTDNDNEQLLLLQ